MLIRIAWSNQLHFLTTRQQLALVNTDSNDYIQRMENEWVGKSATAKHFCGINSTRMAKNTRSNGDRFSNLFDGESNDSEVVEMYKKILKFIFLPSTIVCGIRINYHWKPQRHLMMWFTMFNLAFAWCCFLYTQYVHITSENDKMKVFEVFAAYGVGLSV